MNHHEIYKFEESIHLFISALGAFISIIVTSISMLLLLSIILTNGKSFENNILLIFLYFSTLFLILYSMLTTKVKNVPIGYQTRQIIKRLFDVVFSAFCIFTLMPLILLIALCIKLDSPGPIFYRSKFVGQNGILFETYRFRTKTINNDGTKVTRLGQILRRFLLDELPILYNVLVGEMSIVGPRPFNPIYTEKYLNSKKQILSIKPGLTGLSQVSINKKSSLDDVINYDLKYIKNWSLLFDIKILFKTIFVVFLGNR